MKQYKYVGNHISGLPNDMKKFSYNFSPNKWVGIVRNIVFWVILPATIVFFIYVINQVV